MGSPKDYPWAEELAKWLECDHKLIQVGGAEDKHLTDHFVKNPSFNEVAALVETCHTAICVDSFMQHAMWYFGKKAIVLWGISDPLIFGHDIHVNLIKDRSYLRKNQFDLYYSNEVNPNSFVTPAKVMEELEKIS